MYPQSIIPLLRLSTAERFWEKVHKTETCWLWQAACNKTGYGVFGLATRRNILAHRFSYILHCGTIPDRMGVCHHCDTPPCVNPSHLFLGTQSDNVHDMMSKGRLNPYTSERGSKHHNAKLTETQVGDIRQRHKEGFTYSAIARQYLVHKATIRRAVLGEGWRHVP